MTTNISTSSGVRSRGEPERRRKHWHSRHFGCFPCRGHGLTSVAADPAHSRRARGRGTSTFSPSTNRARWTTGWASRAAHRADAPGGAQSSAGCRWLCAPADCPGPRYHRGSAWVRGRASHRCETSPYRWRLPRSSPQGERVGRVMKRVELIKTSAGPAALGRTRDGRRRPDTTSRSVLV